MKTCLALDFPEMAEKLRGCRLKQAIKVTNG